MAKQQEKEETLPYQRGGAESHGRLCIFLHVQRAQPQVMAMAGEEEDPLPI